MFARVTIYGRIVNEIELKKTSSGKSVCSLTIVVNKGPRENQTSIFNQVDFWEGSAENVAKFFAKGDMIYVDGELGNPDAWVSKKDGSAGARNKINGRQFEFVETRKYDAPATANTSRTNTPNIDDINIDELAELSIDEIPF